MTTEALKSTQVTSLDAVPVTNGGVTAGAGSFAEAIINTATISPTTGMTTGSTYQLMRMASNLQLKSIILYLDASVTTFAGDLTLYYSTSTGDGTAVSKQGTLVTAHVFQTALDLHAITTPTEYLMGGNIKGASLNQPLWQMAALTSDPGGFFDLTLVTTSTTSGSPVLNCQVTAVQP